MSQHLIIFTRFPEPGKAKTRLIPALGAEGAAQLHSQMAEHTLGQARNLRSSLSVELEVRFAGKDVEAMQFWLGSDLHYQPQGQGDLGDRLTHAAQSAFATGATSVVIIGTDCPQLDTHILQKAFEQLRQHDLVIGPAKDGGYYLIGARQFMPELFQGIAWSTSEVLQQTVKVAERMRLTIAYLPMLADVDYPEDLPIWEAVRGER